MNPLPDTKKDLGVILLATVLGVGGGSATNLMDWGGMKEKVEACEKQNGKQWDKIGELLERVAKVEGRAQP